jgi:LacI family transcriptional regulator
MRRRVLAAANELGYEPALLAQSLRRGVPLSLGFVVRDISNPLLAEIAFGAENTFREAGYSTLMTSSHGEPDLDASGIRLFRRRRVDGLLLSLADEKHEATRREIDGVSAPIVLIDRELPGAPPVSSVKADHGAGIRAAVKHLAELGHRRFGLLTGSENLYPSRAIERAMRDACKKAGAELAVERGPFQAEDGRVETERLLDLEGPPTALLTSGNQILVGVLHALRNRGLRIPDDVSVVTFDEIPLLDLLDPPIAVISRHPLELGKKAADLLLSLLRGEHAAKTVRVRTTFEPPASLGRAPR